MPERTPSQTVGPFLHIGLVQGDYGVREIFSTKVADAGMPGTHIRIEGRVLDGEGNTLPDALIELWQADHQGRYAHPADGRQVASNSFRGFGRCADVQTGHVRLLHRSSRDRCRAPAASCRRRTSMSASLARGLLKRLFTRIYFAGDPANAADPILALVPADRRDTLMARPDPANPTLYRFDIRLQGKDETVFFEA